MILIYRITRLFCCIYIVSERGHKKGHYFDVVAFLWFNTMLVAMAAFVASGCLARAAVAAFRVFRA